MPFWKLYMLNDISINAVKNFVGYKIKILNAI